MQRLVSMERVYAHRLNGLRRLPCIEWLLTVDAGRLWRSRPGYRKACRMLRRHGGRR